MSKNEFLIEKYDKLRVDIKMYMCEISKFRISDLKAQKMIILWTMKHVSAIRKHPVPLIYYKTCNFPIHACNIKP